MKSDMDLMKLLSYLLSVLSVFIAVAGGHLFSQVGVGEGIQNRKEFIKVDNFSDGHVFVIEDCEEFIGFFADWTEKPLYIRKKDVGGIEFRARPYDDEQWIYTDAG